MLPLNIFQARFPDLHLYLLHDSRLVFIICIAGAVSLLTTLNVAARPAAVPTGRVALALTISSLFFMLTRFANLFYLPILGAYVDKAAPNKVPDPAALIVLKHQIQFIILGAAAGAFLSWILLPSFIELYRRGIRSMDRHQSMLKVLLRLAKPSTWAMLAATPRMPSMMGVGLGRLSGVPLDFILVNILATAIWTVGALCAMLASAREPEFAATAVLLSGMVNAFAAIAFTIWVDPTAALITDQAIAGERPKEHVTITAVHLSAGNFIGSILGLALLEPGTEWIQWLTRFLGQNGGGLAGSLLMVAGINCIVTLLQAAANMDRISAVLTKRVATALSLYNVFFLVTRLAGQVYSPVLGSISDHAVQTGNIASLGPAFRTVVFGASAGVFIGVLLMPTFVQIYTRAIVELEKDGSLPKLFLRLLHPRAWLAMIRCLRRPTLFGVRLKDLWELPQSFIWGNVFVTSVTTVGVISAIYAGAQLSGHLARTATLLSSVVNGLATITLSIVVSPMAALITDQCAADERPRKHIYSMTVFLMLGMLLGTLLSQLLFGPATWFIIEVARALEHFFRG